jgi:hypothetical protein
MNTKNFLGNLFKYRSISIIGMDKNSGKTTTLNYILENISSGKIIGLTSIGRDGEDKDRVTNTHKPRIYIKRGTIIATSKNLLNKCDITKEILATTGISTPLGEIIIVRALSDGYVDIAGPSFNSALKKVRDEMLNLGCDLVIIDGALSRKGSAGNTISDATILATGASLSPNINRVVAESAHHIEMLQLPETTPTIKKLSLDILSKGKIGFINKGGEVEILNLPTSLNSYRKIIDKMKPTYTHLVLGGAVSQGLIEAIIQNRIIFKNIELVVEDGTKIFINASIYEKLALIPVKIKVLNKIKLLGITCNPSSPYGYSFQGEEFKEMLQKQTNLEVIDVVGDLGGKL